MPKVKTDERKITDERPESYALKIGRSEDK
jgi:hypothetical protein